MMLGLRQVQEGLLAQIEAGVLDDTVPLASLLQKCIVLGGQAGSAKMRDWARQELNGYPDADSVPDYRRIPAPMNIRITNRAGYNPITQRVYNANLPDAFTTKYNVEVAVLGGIGELEALAKRGEDEHRLSPGWASLLVALLNRFFVDAETSQVTYAYWSVSNASIVWLLVRVRTALAELVAELISLTPQGQTVPDKRAADQAVQFVITGDRATINYSPSTPRTAARTPSCTATTTPSQGGTRRDQHDHQGEACERGVVDTVAQAGRARRDRHRGRRHRCGVRLDRLDPLGLAIAARPGVQRAAKVGIRAATLGP